jgi:hypothetical protein
MTTTTRIRSLPFRPNGPENRILRAIQVWIVAKDFRAIICWPDHEPEKPITKLPDASQSWLDVQAGDAILMSEEGVWRQGRIKEVSLYRAHPARYGNRVISSARDWLTGINGTHNSQFGAMADRLPCDVRGYVPNADCEPFDLEWDHIEHTHYEGGILTDYGRWSQSVRWPEIMAEVSRLTARV